MYGHATWLDQATWGTQPYRDAPISSAQVSYDGRTWEDLGDHVEDHRRDAGEDRTNGQESGR